MLRTSRLFIQSIMLKEPCNIALNYLPMNIFSCDLHCIQTPNRQGKSFPKNCFQFPSNHTLTSYLLNDCKWCSLKSNLALTCRENFHIKSTSNNFVNALEKDYPSLMFTHNLLKSISTLGKLRHVSCIETAVCIEILS